MLDWDDLRTVLAIARSGTAAAAAERLGVHASTVFRRLNAMERQHGVRFFERLPDGYVPTAAGEEVCVAAEKVEAEVAVLGRRLSGRDLRPSGTVRVTTTDTLVGLISTDLAGFRRAYPDIDLQMNVTNRFFDLTRHDADVAVRPTVKPPETLVGRRVARVAAAVYAADGYFGEMPANADLAACDWIGPDESLGHLPAARWLETAVPAVRVHYRASTLMAAFEAAKAGVGLCVLPTFLGDPEPRLQRVRDPLPELESTLWLLTHPDLRYVARVKAFMDFAADALGRQRDTLEGRGAPANGLAGR
ncbi:LysR family transcriptional regulator [Arhodomonas sp. AD133]|uniref:LysR family transcriptional regulator n=1 Tax=Arhodomonas sp. AD133 TaxID=3415009 RepID=UPI003EC0AEE3